MSQNNSDFDAFLRQKLASLPDAPASDFNAVAAKMGAKRNRWAGGVLLASTTIIALLLAVPYFFGNASKYQPRSGREVQEQEQVQSRPDNYRERSGQGRTLDEKPNEGAGKLAQPNPSVILVEENVLSESPTKDIIATESNPPESEHNVPALEIAQKPNLNVGQTEGELAAPKVVFVPEMDADTTTKLPAVISSEDVRETDRWSAVVNIYPNFTFREFQIKSAKQDYVNRSYEEIIKESERGGIAVNVGVDVRYHLGNNVFVSSGLAFIQTKINGAYNYYISESPNMANNGTIKDYTPLTNEISINQGIIQTYQYVQVPLHISYQPWVNKRLRLIIEGGLSYIRLLHVDGQTVDYQSLALRDLSTMDFNKNLGSFDFKVGASYFINPKIAMGLEPTMMYFNQSLFKETSPLYMVPWSVGVNFNLRFTLF